MGILEVSLLYKITNMKFFLIGALSVTSFLTNVFARPTLAQEARDINKAENVLEFLVRDGITWYLVNPISTDSSVFFNIYAENSQDNTRLSIIAEAECKNRKRFVVKSERLYLATGGFTQNDDEVVHTDLPGDSPFGMAHNIVCSQSSNANSGNRSIFSGNNSSEEQVNFSPELKSIKLVTGQCLKATINQEDVTEECQGTIAINTYKSGRTGFMVTLRGQSDNVLLISFSGIKEQRPSFKKYSLVLDQVTIAYGEETSKSSVNGSCSIQGNLTNEVSTIKCLVEESESRLEVQFRSDGKKPEVIYADK